MKKAILVLLVLAVWSSAGAQVTLIRDIQYTTAPTGDSPLKDQIVTISGVVTGEIYAFKNSYYYV